MSEVSPKKHLKLQKIPEIIYKCRKAHIYSLKISVFSGVKEQQAIPVWKTLCTYFYVAFSRSILT